MLTIKLHGETRELLDLPYLLNPSFVVVSAGGVQGSNSLNRGGLMEVM